MQCFNSEARTKDFKVTHWINNVVYHNLFANYSLPNLTLDQHIVKKIIYLLNSIKNILMYSPYKLKIKNSRRVENAALEIYCMRISFRKKFFLHNKIFYENLNYCGKYI